MTSWFSIARAARDAAAADIAIYDEIGSYGIDAMAFRRELAELGDVQRIDLRVNSPGGQIYDGIAIANMLARHPARVVATVDGIAASIASLVCMAADEVVMPENALMMVHNPAGGIFGTADDMRDWADALDKMSTAMIASYARKTGKTPEALKAILDAETWMTAAEAKANGFADRILPARKMQAKFDVAARYPKAPTASIALLGAELVEPTAAAASDWTCSAAEGLAIDKRESWDGDAARDRMLASAGFGGQHFDPAKAAKGFLAYDRHNPSLKQSWKLPFADVADGGEFKAMSGGLRAAAGRLSGTDIPDDVKTRARAVLDHYERRLAADDPNNSAARTAAATETDMEQAQVEKIVADAIAAERKKSDDAIAADRKRSADILALDEAKGREALATALAAQGLSVEAAKAILAAAPKASALEARAGGFNPGAPLGGGTGAGAEKQSEIDKGWAVLASDLNRRHGVKAPYA
jgi:ATP-dependent protease ClpP protease subunit